MKKTKKYNTITFRPTDKNLLEIKKRKAETQSTSSYINTILNDYHNRENRADKKLQDVLFEVIKLQNAVNKLDEKNRKIVQKEIDSIWQSLT